MRQDHGKIEMKVLYASSEHICLSKVGQPVVGTYLMSDDRRPRLRPEANPRLLICHAVPCPNTTTGNRVMGSMHEELTFIYKFVSDYVEIKFDIK